MYHSKSVASFNFTRMFFITNICYFNELLREVNVNKVILPLYFFFISNITPQTNRKPQILGNRIIDIMSQLFEVAGLGKTVCCLARYNHKYVKCYDIGLILR